MVGNAGFTMKIKGFKDTIKWYDKNARQYAISVEDFSNKEQIDEFVELLPKNAKVLDAGCGGGRDSNSLAAKGINVIGIDLSTGLLKIAKAKYQNIQFIRGDIRKIPFKDLSFDGVWSQASLLHLETVRDIEEALVEFHRILKKDGIVHILVKARKGKEKTAIIKDSLSKHERFFQYFTQEELKALLNKHRFKILIVKQYNEAQARAGGRT